jgi:hypothetical protein
VDFSVGHRSLGFPFGEAETTPRADYPSTEVGVTRRGRGALGAAVSVEEAEAVETRPSCIDSDLLSAAGTCVGKSGKRAAQDAFQAFVLAVNVVRFLGEDSTDVTLAKAETSQGSESLRS